MLLLAEKWRRALTDEKNPRGTSVKLLLSSRRVLSRGTDHSRGSGPVSRLLLMSRVKREEKPPRSLGSEPLRPTPLTLML